MDQRGITIGTDDGYSGKFLQLLYDTMQSADCNQSDVCGADAAVCAGKIF